MMRGRRKLGLLLVVACFGLGSIPARAGLFDDDEARNRIESLRRDLTEQGKRIDAVTTTAANATGAQLDLANQIEQLKAELARLRGQAEVMTYDLETAQKRQKDFYVDLDTRLRKMESAIETAAETPEKPETSPRDPAAEARDYETALTLFKASKFKEAKAAFEGFIANYENSSLLPSAHFWAASAHYQLREFPKAAELFGKVQATWPSDAKAADALLGQANSYREAGNLKAMRKTLELLVGKYPASAAATSARGRLSAR